MLRLMVLPEINQMASTRDLLIDKLWRLENGDFSVSIGGNEREGAEVMRQIKPVLRNSLKQQIAQVDRSLADYGVSTD